jgi:hypothetical protein
MKLWRPDIYAGENKNMSQKTPNTSQLETLALAAVLTSGFAAVPLLMWSVNGTLWFFG